MGESLPSSEIAGTVSVTNFHASMRSAMISAVGGHMMLLEVEGEGALSVAIVGP